MRWVYLSPHFDDVALSCGGLVWEQAHSGDQVEIWTVCAGDPPDTPLSPFAQSLHDRWQTSPRAVEDRRQEDQRAAQALGATIRRFDWPDCIYRFRPENGHPVIRGEYDLFHAEPEESLVNEVSAKLASTLPAGVRLVCPMAIGDHVDHHLTRRAAERLGAPLFFYPDYPYILQLPTILEKMEGSGARGGAMGRTPASPDEKWTRLAGFISEEGLSAWQKSIAAYQSQISTFWHKVPDMELAIRNYWAGGGGRLWKIKIT